NYYADAGQRQIVMAVHGNEVDFGGSNSDIEAALQVASAATCSIGTYGSDISVLSQSHLYWVKLYLESGKWVVASITTEGEYSGYNSLHATVITGYYHDPADGKDYFDMWDPWDNEESCFYIDSDDKMIFCDGTGDNNNNYGYGLSYWRCAFYCN
ncbi:MAG: C39 family peptidase, partial [Clostridia bacterium]|nr:C39 family peptidase [Clostridia bacterium]